MSALLASVLAAAAAWVLLPGHPAGRLALLGLGGSGHLPSRSRAERLRTDVRDRLPGGGRRRAQRRRRALEACAALAGELRSGQPMRPALLASLEGVAPHAMSAARWGGDVPAALRRDAEREGGDLWRAVAACWEVSESSGAGLASALDHLIGSARAAEEVRVQLEAHLAAPRATARMLATLPAIGILLGLALGGDPLGWLIGTSIGRGCLAAGLAFTAAGLWWVHRIADRVERHL